jgi:hypothetical protein
MPEDPIGWFEQCALNLVSFEWKHIQPTARARMLRERRRLVEELVKAEGPALKLLEAHCPLKEATELLAAVEKACQGVQARPLERTISKKIEVATGDQVREELQLRTDNVHDALAPVITLRRAIEMVSRTPASDAAAVGRVAGTDDTSTQSARRPVPNERTEQPVIDALYKMGAIGIERFRKIPRDKRPTGERLAPKAIGRDSDGQFKATLAHMVDLGWLDNGRNHGIGGGYFLTDSGAGLASQRQRRRRRS